MIAPLRAAGLALLLLGAALLGYATLAEPPPTDFATAFQRLGVEDAAPERMLVHGPAVGSRYDARNHTTLAVFDCMGAHIVCNVALALAGDQRAAVATDGLMVRPSEGATFAREPLDEPFPMRYGGDATERFVGIYEIVPRWPGAAERLAGVGALVVGAALALGSRSLATGAAAWTALVALMLGQNEATWLILSQGLLVLFTLAGLVTLLAAQKRPRGRAVGLGLLAFAPVLVGTFLSGALAFYPFKGV